MSNNLKTLRVAALQLPTHPRYQENLEKLLSYLDNHQYKHIVVVPEVFLTGLDYEHLATAAKFSTNALKTLKKKVHEQTLILTLILKDGDNFINQAIVIHKHKIIHKQEKTKLFKLGNEDLYFKAGKKKKIKPFVLDGAKFAILICFELRFKELWKQIEGVDVVLIPSRWGKPRKKHLEVLSEALAVMNQCYVILSNASNTNMAVSSSIISPSGDSIREEDKEIIERTIDFREIKKIRRYISMN